MKKSAFLAILIICVLFVFSCKSTASTTDNTASARGAADTTTSPTAGSGNTATGSAAGSGTTSGGTSGSVTSGGATSGIGVSRYEAGTTYDRYWNVYNRYSSNLDLTGAERYTVVRGDQLRLIAEKYYGNQLYYPVILLASRDVIVHPDELEIGMVLIIPNLQRNLNNASSRQAIKDIILEVSEMRRSEGQTDAANNLRNFANGI